VENRTKSYPVALAFWHCFFSPRFYLFWLAFWFFCGGTQILL